MANPGEVVCPHCGAANPAGSAFCESCGKALPAAVPTGPRVLTGDVLPASAAGKQMLGDELTKQTKKAANTLLFVGILQMTCGAILVAILSQASARVTVPHQTIVLLVAQFIVAGVFLGLYFWARRSPLPATITGLVVYCTLVALNVVTSLAAMGHGQRGSGFGGIGIGWLDIVIIAILAQGIQAAMKYKRLAEMAAVAA